MQATLQHTAPSRRWLPPPSGQTILLNIQTTLNPTSTGAFRGKPSSMLRPRLRRTTQASRDAHKQLLRVMRNSGRSRTRKLRARVLRQPTVKRVEGGGLSGVSGEAGSQSWPESESSRTVSSRSAAAAADGEGSSLGQRANVADGLASGEALGM